MTESARQASSPTVASSEPVTSNVNQSPDPLSRQQNELQNRGDAGAWSTSTSGSSDQAEQPLWQVDALTLGGVLDRPGASDAADNDESSSDREDESGRQQGEQEDRITAAERFAESNVRLQQATELLLQVSQLGGPVNIRALLDEHI